MVPGPRLWAHLGLGYWGKKAHFRGTEASTFRPGYDKYEFSENCARKKRLSVRRKPPLSKPKSNSNDDDDDIDFSRPSRISRPSSSSMDNGSDKGYSPDLASRDLAGMSSSLPPTTTSVHVTALDGLVNVNSLFTIAVFVGLSLTTPGQHSLENPGGCDAGIEVVKRLLVFEVVSFSFFLFSSLVAQGLKLAINLLNSKDVDEAFRAKISLRVLRLAMLGSAIGSIMGCLFLMLSMVCIIEIRLGTLSCGSRPAINAVAALVVLVSSALVVYISTAVYSFMQ